MEILQFIFNNWFEIIFGVAFALFVFKLVWEM
jgi:hypothetical protein